MNQDDIEIAKFVAGVAGQLNQISSQVTSKSKDISNNKLDPKKFLGTGIRANEKIPLIPQAVDPVQPPPLKDILIPLPPELVAPVVQQPVPVVQENKKEQSQLEFNFKLDSGEKIDFNTPKDAINYFDNRINKLEDQLKLINITLKEILNSTKKRKYAKQSTA